VSNRRQPGVSTQISTRQVICCNLSMINTDNGKYTGNFTRCYIYVSVICGIRSLDVTFINLHLMDSRLFGLFPKVDLLFTISCWNGEVKMNNIYRCSENVEQSYFSSKLWENMCRFMTFCLLNIKIFIPISMCKLLTSR